MSNHNWGDPADNVRLYFTYNADAVAKYSRDQRRWLRATGLKVGATVKVISKAEDGQSGWPTIWVPQMDNVTGGTVTGISRDGIQIDDGAWFPFYVLVREDIH